MPPQIDISVVVPICDEEDSLPLLHAEIATALAPYGDAWEVLYVNDRSQDQSLAVMLKLRESDPHIRVLHFRRNFGQTAAMAAGFEHARGRVVVTLDGDLQNDPADIPRLLDKIEEGYDIVAGWRKVRHDGFILRRLPSIAANRLIAWVTDVPIHDTGCTLKAMRRELVENLPIYAEQHRFLPAMSAGSGARVAELVVNHRARRFGESKYGIGRATRVALDLMTIKMISSFSQRPGQYFGMLAMPFVFGIIVFLGVAFANWGIITLRETWGYVVVMSVMLFSMTCVYFVLLGLLAELVVKASGIHDQKSRVLVRSLEY